MSNIVLKPKEQKKLEKKLEKLSLMIGGLSTPTSVRLHSMITDIGILVANADMDAKSTDTLPFVICARKYYSHFPKAIRDQTDILRLPSIAQMRQICECYDNPLSEGDYWVSDEISNIEKFVFNLNDKGDWKLISDSQEQCHSYFYIKDREIEQCD